MFGKYQEVPAYVTLEGVVDVYCPYLRIAKTGIAEQELSFDDKPGIAVISPNTAYTEIVAFKKLSKTMLYGDRVLTINDITRGVEGKGPFNHPAQSEVFIDQGEQYLSLIENSGKEVLRRCLLSLI